MSPVLSTCGVLNPWHVHPLTVTGAPPPLPGTWPAWRTAAYLFSIFKAVEQATLPVAIVMTTGTPAAV